MVLNPDIFDDVLLNKVKNSIKDIKRNSALYNELNYLEWVRISGNIEKIKEDIKSNSNLSEKDKENIDRKSTRLNSSHSGESRMPSSA